MRRYYADKLISSAEVIKNLHTIVWKLPETQRQVRPLKKLPPEQQANDEKGYMKAARIVEIGEEIPA